MIWVVRSHGSESQIAAQWLVRRFVDPQAIFAAADDLSSSKRRNGSLGAPPAPLVSDFAELTSFNGLLKQHGLASDPALLFLSDFLNSTHPQNSPGSSPSHGSDPDQDHKRQALALLDNLYEWLHEQVQDDLDHP